MFPRTRRGRVAAGSYLVVVLATSAFVLATFTVFPQDGANLSIVWLVVVALPWSAGLVVLNSPGASIPDLALALGLIASVVLNLMLVGWIGDRRR